MKLYHGNYIIPGLVVFLVIVTFPLWFAAASNKEPFESLPNPDGEQCIESKEFMRANHMQLLVEWRDEVVREGQRVYTSQSDGRKWEKSLTKTCMTCHDKVDASGKSTSPATYCIDCHDYVGVATYCWDCHIDPAAVRKEVK